MDWYQAVNQNIDFRSFSNIWYWIMLALCWSVINHRVMGIPYDLILRGARAGGQHELDVETLAAIHARRVQGMLGNGGGWAIGLGAALIVSLILLGWIYGFELAQAMTCLLVPLSGVMIMSVHTSACILGGDSHGPALFRRLRLHRIITQSIGMLAIFATALWGMYVNMSIGALL